MLRTDEFQAVTSTYFYEAYGKPLGTSPTEYNPYRYGGTFGYYTDSEIQALQVGARWYSPHLIRWMSRDPIHYRGGDNLSAYVMGNPVKFVDPSGTIILPIDPSGLVREWLLDASHRNPNGLRFIDSSGRALEFHKGQPGKPGFRGLDHWHDPKYFGPKHLPPGCEVPDPAPRPITKPPRPPLFEPTWWVELLNGARPLYPMFIVDPNGLKPVVPNS